MYQQDLSGKWGNLTVSQSLEDQVRAAECYNHLLEPSQDNSQHQGIFSIFIHKIFVNSTAAGRSGNHLIIDPLYHDWFRTIRIIQNVLKFIGAVSHRRNHIIKGIRLQYL